jgi:hypothetical protein
MQLVAATQATASHFRKTDIRFSPALFLASV